LLVDGRRKAVLQAEKNYWGILRCLKSGNCANNPGYK